MTMILIEVACLVIVLSTVCWRARRDDGKVYLGRLAVIAVAAWIAEDTCIHFYGFYFYSEDWHLFLDKVPILIPMIWPVVILSAWDLARPLTARASSLLAMVFVLVLSDACFIEPVSVHLEFWWWTSPGFFEVPVIGVVGWALFALVMVGFLNAPKLTVKRALTSLIVGPVVVHGGLLFCWWTCLRPLSAPITDAVAVWVALILGSVATLLALLSSRSIRVSREDVLSRLPAALFFFVVLALVKPEGRPMLWVYIAAFAPPYWVLLLRPRGKALEIGLEEGLEKATVEENGGGLL